MNTRVIIFMRNCEGGVATYIRNLLLYADHDNFDFLLVLISDRHSSSMCDPADFTASRTIILRPEDNIARKFFEMRECIESPEDIIISNEVTELQMANCYRIRNPIIHFIHGDGSYNDRIIKRYARIIDAFIGVSNSVSHQCKSALEAQRLDRPVETLYVPLEDSIARDLKLSNLLRIVCIGRLTHEKGMDVVPDIINGLDERSINYELSVIGSGILDEELKRELATAKGVCRFFGQLPHEKVLEQLRSQDVLLFPTRSEALGLVMVEAMKNGVIPVASNVGGIKEIINHSKSGFLVKTGEVEKFVEYIALIANDHAFHSQIRISAQKRADSLFSHRNIKSLERILHSLVDGHFSKEFIRRKPRIFFISKSYQLIRLILLLRRKAFVIR